MAVTDKHGIPIECRARMKFIHQRAFDLQTTFINGNKRDLLAALEDLPPRMAFAVLATVCQGDGNVASYLREMA